MFYTTNFCEFIAQLVVCQIYDKSKKLELGRCNRSGGS